MGRLRADRVVGADVVVVVVVLLVVGGRVTTFRRERPGPNRERDADAAVVVVVELVSVDDELLVDCEDGDSAAELNVTSAGVSDDCVGEYAGAGEIVVSGSSPASSFCRFRLRIEGRNPLPRDERAGVTGRARGLAVVVLVVVGADVVRGVDDARLRVRTLSRARSRPDPNRERVRDP